VLAWSARLELGAPLLLLVAPLLPRCGDFHDFADVGPAGFAPAVAGEGIFVGVRWLFGAGFFGERFFHSPSESHAGSRTARLIERSMVRNF
jgi:hypothetical protein